jgi:hypothetical protein
MAIIINIYVLPNQSLKLTEITARDFAARKKII